MDDGERGDVLGQVGEAGNISSRVRDLRRMVPFMHRLVVLMDRGGVIAQRLTGFDGEPRVFALFERVGWS